MNKYLVNTAWGIAIIFILLPLGWNIGSTLMGWNPNPLSWSWKAPVVVIPVMNPPAAGPSQVHKPQLGQPERGGLNPFAGQPLDPTPGAYRATWSQVSGGKSTRIFLWKPTGEIRRDTRLVNQNRDVLVEGHWVWDMEGNPTMPLPGD